jgi:hypothetical protein
MRPLMTTPVGINISLSPLRSRLNMPRRRMGIASFNPFYALHF